MEFYHKKSVPFLDMTLHAYLTEGVCEELRPVVSTGSSLLHRLCDGPDLVVLGSHAVIQRQPTRGGVWVPRFASHWPAQNTCTWIAVQGVRLFSRLLYSISLLRGGGKCKFTGCWGGFLNF